MSVDNRLVEYWRRQLASRRRLRAVPPIRKPAAPAPEPETGSPDPSGTDASSNVVPMAFEDR